MSISIQSLNANEALKYRDHLAQLRLSVFKDFPYLYEGTLEDEQEYLDTFFKAKDAVLVLSFDGEKVVGASTGMPLNQETLNIQSPWLEHGHPVETIFYFSESVLLPAYRGKGIGVRFFKERETFARKLNCFNLLTFCGVVRPDDHPLRPKEYLPLDNFWQNRGFRRQDGYICYISWKDVDEDQESEKPLQFWSKEI